MKTNNSSRRTILALLLIPLLSLSAVSLLNDSSSATTLELSQGSHDLYMQIDGIKGSTSTTEVKDGHDILSFSFATFIEVSQAGSEKRSTGAPSFTEVAVLKHVDGASPLLFQACAEGTTLKEVTLSAWKSSSSKPTKFIELKLEDAICNLYAFVADGDSDILEQISFTFTKITFEVTPQNQDGSAGNPVSGGWDTVRNEKP